MLGVSIKKSVQEAIFIRPELPELAERAALRKKAGISQTILGEIIGCTRRMIWQYENGHAAPTGDRLVRYAEALDAISEELAEG